MRTIRNTLFLLLACFPLQLAAQALPKGSPRQLGFSPQRLERITETFNEYAREEKLAGGVILIARDGRIAYQHAFGMRDIASRSRMTPDVIFRIASQTKAVVSVATMMLMEEGALQLDDRSGAGPAAPVRQDGLCLENDGARRGRAEEAGGRAEAQAEAQAE